MSKLNIWFFNNIKIFKIKFLNQIEFFISSLNSLKLVKLKIFYKDYSFEDVYFFLFKFFFLFFFLFFFFLFV